MSPCIIVLAAGQGSRFRAAGGQDKLLARCVGRDGRAAPVLEHVLRSFSRAAGRKLLVTRPDQPEVCSLGQAEGFEVLTLESAGMGDSLAAAVTYAGVQAAWLIALGDMPFIAPQTLMSLLGPISIAPDAIRIPLFAGQRGHPVLFGADFGSALMALRGDKGAKGLFQTGRLEEIEVNDAGVCWDVDTPQRLLFS